jgi:predicted flap endonuclease-1-like 5' DNA nuclease
MTSRPATAEPTTQRGCAGCGKPQSATPATHHPTKPEPAHPHRRLESGCGQWDHSECGCCEKHPPPCQVECLERPLFTCGMVLSDSDLTALVDWTRARLALRRYREGWGVVCGLDVRCDPDQPGSVLVDPGYAVGCCGEDIVVCEPTSVDLTDCCSDDEPCAQPEEKKEEKGKEEKKDPCGDFVVDLMLESEDVPTVTELVDKCGCSDSCSDQCGSCSSCSDQSLVPTRMRECARIRPHLVYLRDTDPVSRAEEDWMKAYSACHKVVNDYVELGVKSSDAEGILKWLKKQDLHPPCNWWETTSQSLFKAEQAKQDTDELKGNKSKTGGQTEGTDDVDTVLAASFLDLVVSCRQRLLRRACDHCTSTDRLPLARVWLRRPNTDRKEGSCVVVNIDAYPPYRRDLAPYSRPVAAGSYDLTPFIWQRWEQICIEWRKLTGDTTATRTPVPQSTSDLRDLLEQTQWVSWTCQEQAPVPVVLTTDCLGDRVLGFTKGSLEETGGVSHDSDNANGAAATAAAYLTPTPDAMPEAPDAAADPTGQAAAPPVELRLVAGIGPISAIRLVGAGISTVKDLAGHTTEQLRPILGKSIHINAILDDAKQRLEQAS